MIIEMAGGFDNNGCFKCFVTQNALDLKKKVKSLESLGSLSLIFSLDVFAPILCLFCELARISILRYSASFTEA